MYAIYVQGTALDTRGIPVNNTGESNNFCTLLAHVLAQQVNYPVGKEAASTRKEHSKAEVGNVWRGAMRGVHGDREGGDKLPKVCGPGLVVPPQVNQWTAS